jgi:hypothetical protein
MANHPLYSDGQLSIFFRWLAILVFGWPAIHIAKLWITRYITTQQDNDCIQACK